ncbi:MAG: hypothetical protein LQ340_005395 [Diploschistes diacapsis]|nr:MAG: hypothetical protein LQ340_005395 [Diploschistes diacapsis]
MLGLLALTGANVMLCFGTTVPILLIGRLLQGMAAAVVWAVGFAMAPETAGPENAGEALGWVSLGINFGALVGPTAGGVVFAKAGYYAVFAMTFALLGLDVVLRAAMIERKVALKTLGKEEEDEGPERADRDEIDPLVRRPDTEAPSGKQGASKAHPLPMLLFLQLPRFVSALWGIMVLSTMITAFDSALPLYVHDIFGWESLGSGLLFLSTCCSSFLEPFLGRLADRYGTRWLVIIAFAGMVAPYILLRLVTDDTVGDKAFLVALLAVIGICWSIGMTPLNAEVSRIVVEVERRSPGIYGERGALAQAFGLTNMAFAAGSIVGPLWGGFMKENIGWGNMTTSIGLLSAMTVIPTVSPAC